MDNIKEKFLGSLIGGALGDALGYNVEFLSLSQIKEAFGDKGITELILDNKSKKALISDDTQMALFTVDGLIWSYLRFRERGIGSYAGSGIYQSYLRWLYTQTGSKAAEPWLKKQPHEIDNTIVKYKKTILEYSELYASRAPGNSCLSALSSGKMGTIDNPINNSKGCGGVMRIAPVGLFLHKDPEYAFRVGAEVAALTHGHPTGYLAAGVLAAQIAEIINGKSITEGIKTGMHISKTYKNNKELLSSIDMALNLSKSNMTSENIIKMLGEGWTAEEALAIALYCSLKGKNSREAIIMAVNHNGDSDSTGAICGNIVGAINGVKDFPEPWIENLEVKELIEDLGIKLYDLSEKLKD